MGILNVTPDSFSDGGRHLAVEAAVAAAHRMIEAGADLLDIGGESTRPGARPVTAEAEQERVLPVLQALLDADMRVPLSIDTRHAATAAAALDQGVALVNDVSALRDPGMGPLIAERDVPVVLMHMQGTPGTMQAAPHYDDVVAEVAAGLERSLVQALDQGIRIDRILLDPGLGFGKRTGGGSEDNCRLLSALPRLGALGRPLLVGASRKRFIGQTTGAPVEARLPGSLVAAVAAAWGGASVVRVHDVAETVQALRVAAWLDPSEWSTGAKP